MGMFKFNINKPISEFSTNKSILPKVQNLCGLHKCTNTESTLLQKYKAQPVPVPTYQNTKCIPSGTSSLVYGAQRRMSPTTYENLPNDRSQIPKQKTKRFKEYLYSFRCQMVLVCSCSDPIEARSPSRKSRGYPSESCSQWVLQPSRAGPIWVARTVAVKG